jgi:hypothetical protein
MILHRNIDPRRLSNAGEFKSLETQGHRFAAAFLLPSSSFAEDFIVPTLDALRPLKSKWGVSIGMMIKRAEQLQLISEADAKRLWIGMSRRGWRTREPLDDTLPVEPAGLLRESFELLVEEGVQSREQMRRALPFATADIEELAGLPAGFLHGTERNAAVVELRPGIRQWNRASSGEREGQVVDFQRDSEKPKE